MPYNPVFTFEYSEAYTDGLGGVLCRTRVTLLRQDWSLPVVTILPAGEPLEWEWADSSDDPFTPVRPTKLTLNLAVEDYWNPLLLNATGRTEVMVIVDKDRFGDGLWRSAFLGFLQPDNSRDTYGPRPYEKVVYATDGLALLEQKAALGLGGKPIVGPLQTLSGVLQACLLQTGLSRPMTTALNLYHLTDMAAGQLVNGKPDETKDPLYQTQLNTDWLIDDQNGTRSAFSVIGDILRVFGCQLCQWDGDWWVRRVVEADGLHDAWNDSRQTIRTRRYNNPSAPYAPPVAGGSVSVDQRVFVGARGSGSVTRVVAGGPVEFLSAPTESLRVEQTFGRALDRLQAGFGQLDNTNLPVGWQRLHKTAQTAYGVGTGTEADPFAVIIKGYGDELLALDQPGIYKVLEFDKQSSTFQKGQKFTIKGSFLLNKLRAAQITVWGVRLPDGDQGPVLGRQELVLLNSDGSWKSSPSKKDQVTIRLYHSYDEGRKTMPGSKDFSITTPEPIDKLIKLVVKLGVGEDLDKPGGGALENPGAFTKFWNVRLETEQQNPITYQGQGVTFALPDRINPDPIIKLTLGDTPDAVNPYGINSTLYDRAGNATAKWFEARSNAINGTDAGMPLYRVLGKDQARQKLTGQAGFEGDIVGQLPWGPLSILHIDGIGEVDGAGLFQHYPLLITRWKLLDRSAIHTVTAVRIASADGPVPAPATPGGKPDWMLEGGATVPQVDDEQGLPVPLPVTGLPAFPGITLPTLPPALLDRLKNLPGLHDLPGLIAGGSIGAVLKLDAGTGAPPALGVALYRPVPDNLNQFIDEPA